MRPILDMATVQIEITNFCRNSCSNCTRFCGHFKKPYFMDFDTFKKAVDSMQGFPNMIGLMGGEPLLHPHFEEFCEYLGSKVSPERCGLWTCFPEGKEHYREIICKTFKNIFLNDHSRDDIFHAPVLVAANELMRDKLYMWYLIDHCWLQRSWSASINPRGAFFCECAAAMSMLFNFEKGWAVEPGWWKRTPKDFVSQMETYCPRCGMAMPLERRISRDGRDDISPNNLARLQGISPKIEAGRYIVHDLQPKQDTNPHATYKDEFYRKGIGDRYGIFLMDNERNFQTPYLKRNWEPNKTQEVI